MSIIKERIIGLAKRNKISLPKLEETLGFGNSTIVKWDKASPSSDKLLKVANYFGVSLDYLIGNDNIEKEPLKIEGLTEQERAILDFYRSAPAEIRAMIDKIVSG